MSTSTDSGRARRSAWPVIVSRIRPIPLLPLRQRGLSLIEMLLAVVLGTMLLVSVFSFAEQGSRQMRQAAAGAELKQLGQAVKNYIMNHYAALETVATPTGAVTVPLAELIAEGYLPPGYTGQNPYGDTYTLYVLEPKAGDLAAITLGAGGFRWKNDLADNHYADVVIPGAAQAGGPAAGYVATGEIPGEVHDGLVGAYGGWSFSIVHTSIPNPGPGHLALLEYFSNGTFSADQLYRVALPGHPELNEMFTDLDMGNQSIRNAHEISATGNLATSGLSVAGGFPNGVTAEGIHTWNLFANHGIYAGTDSRGNPEVAIHGGQVAAEGDITAEHGQVALSHAVAYETLAQNGSVISQPPYCPTGSAPEIFITPVFIAGGPVAYPIGGYQAWATVSGHAWTIHAQVLTQMGWESPPAPYLVVKAAVKCG